MASIPGNIPGHALVTGRVYGFSALYLQGAIVQLCHPDLVTADLPAVPIPGDGGCRGPAGRAGQDHSIVFYDISFLWYSRRQLRGCWNSAV